MKHKLKFGLPKGSLQEATIEKMAKAGFNISVSSRSYLPYVDDEEMEIRLIRAQEISRYVEHGYLDCGITGHDWVVENGSDVHEVGEFLFSKATRQPASRRTASRRSAFTGSAPTPSSVFRRARSSSRATAGAASDGRAIRS